MSRIHEALKKAEQERAEAARADGVLSTPGLSQTAAGVSAATLESPRPPAPAVESDSHAPITADAIETRCSHPHWTPEPKVAQLFSQANSAMGTEELRTLRSRLYQIRDRQPLRTLLITSALPGEGKTFLTTGLAHMIVRQHGRRALIIDADLRRSQLHLALGAPVSPGLTEYLMGFVDELSIIQRGMGTNLYFIPGGKTVSNPAELLANGRLRLLLERLAPAFDWILMDSPPVVPVHDASVLAGYCDGVLLVVHAASTPFDLAQKARTELQEKRLLGVILNRVEDSQTYHSYYYNYYGRNGSGAKQKKK